VRQACELAPPEDGLAGMEGLFDAFLQMVRPGKHRDDKPSWQSVRAMLGDACPRGDGSGRGRPGAPTRGRATQLSRSPGPRASARAAAQAKGADGASARSAQPRQRCPSFDQPRQRCPSFDRGAMCEALVAEFHGIDGTQEAVPLASPSTGSTFSPRSSTSATASVAYSTPPGSLILMEGPVPASGSAPLRRKPGTAA